VDGCIALGVIGVDEPACISNRHACPCFHAQPSAALCLPNLTPDVPTPHRMPHSSLSHDSLNPRPQPQPLKPTHPKQPPKTTATPHPHPAAAHRVPIGAPARFTTASAPATAAPHCAGPKNSSPGYGSFPLAPATSRVSTRTVLPPAASLAARRLPMRPVAPWDDGLLGLSLGWVCWGCRGWGWGWGAKLKVDLDDLTRKEEGGDAGRHAPVIATVIFSALTSLTTRNGARPAAATRAPPALRAARRWGPHTRCCAALPPSAATVVALLLRAVAQPLR